MAGAALRAGLRGWTRGVSVLEELAVPEESECELTLYQAVPKGGRMDLVVEKATEVGATRIVPLLTERGVVNPREGEGRTAGAGWPRPRRGSRCG